MFRHPKMDQHRTIAPTAYQRLDPREEWRTRLIANGVRPTRARVAVAEALAELQDATVAQILTAAHDGAPGLSKQSVYAILGDLQTHGLITEVPSIGPRTYVIASANLRAALSQPAHPLLEN